MADQDAQDRNLPASARKLSKAREQGQIARSRDLGHFAAIAVGGAVLVAAAPAASGWLKQSLARALQFDHRAVQNPGFMVERLAELAATMMWMVLPLGLLMSIVAVAVGVISGGWNFTLKPLQPKFHFLDPIGGVMRLFSKQQAIDALKACGLALVLGTIGALYLKAHVGEFASVLGMDLPAAVSSAAGTVLGGLALLVLALAVFAAIDVPLQRKLHADKLKMSVQELKQEHKESEGNQEVKGKQKARMREMTKRRMLAAVPKADLVVMNPTHYAVALKYEDGKMSAPRVVAKGADLLALKIRDIAKTSKVPVLQAPVLARALYAHTKLDHEIPTALFAAVAQVLAYVYQLRAAMAGQAPQPGDLPELPVPAELDPHHTPAPDMEHFE
ncbi:EscU/YscU/HrcU family type III secretion system export apparatus switch protein [Rhizobacter sp. AJA081-3]|uniref:EscU/YscU/HrcU family type III secretion system export apparatus switch protein n=1 Tax=Rhizobacter sp. AJA081-3 TaxID=2753607 RepID=UPI001AE09B15|nr:flagellar type III secretion system protein FlhB [Rhizobacter sp. AJA081-3]QTN24063.1 EscU/YscU/HrcU family type III secretion system export apparatus switch protein [Rhizobacter sp. AJA081-3]